HQALTNESRRCKAVAPTACKRSTLSSGSVEMPVQVLQQVLKKFTFKELGEMRCVHPYWDELCGQALNSGYCEVVKKADKMLTECQRRVHNERQLHSVLALLTNIQVHILNPIDILRPAMDEGVCCFLYGDLLDKIFTIVAKARLMMNGEYDLAVDWKSVAELARRAQIHYKTNLEAVMEEKLSDVVRLKALQRIQRIDSFMIDSTVTKLEKAAHMARDDLEWEIEQLRQQNSQLRKDNRELKMDYMRLESRIEVLENKFRTMARLLQ
uniref:F-box domain-containing protein n=1 Tax=Parascaris univalens TaxID=6257 RepID=A0A915BRK3_PARUN